MKSLQRVERVLEGYLWMNFIDAVVKKLKRKSGKSFLASFVSS